jgi:Flp pilus assembly protein TadG
MMRDRCGHLSGKATTSHDSQNGQSYVEFIIVLPLFLIVIAGIIGFGRLLYTKLAVEAAAWSGARHAVATLDRDRGINQAHQATRHTLSGFALDPDSADTHVTVWGQWGRGTQVAVRVCYTVPPPPIPMGDTLLSSQICAEQTMPVYRWKSEW